MSYTIYYIGAGGLSKFKTISGELELRIYEGGTIYITDLTNKKLVFVADTKSCVVISE